MRLLPRGHQTTDFADARDEPIWHVHDELLQHVDLEMSARAERVLCILLGLLRMHLA